MTDRLDYLRKKIKTAREARERAVKHHRGQAKARRAFVSAVNAMLREEFLQQRREHRRRTDAQPAPDLLSLVTPAHAPAFDGFTARTHTPGVL